MAKFYVKDGILVKLFDSISEVVSFLENVIIFKKKMNRKQWMQELTDLGHGYDDPNGENFTLSMREFVDVGVVKSDSTFVKCNIHDVSKHKPEHGD